ECQRQLARSRTEILQSVTAAPLAHEPNPAPRLERTHQDQSVAPATLHQQVEQPVHAVVEIDVGGSRLMPLHELARTWSRSRVTGRMALGGVGLGFDNDP